MPQDPPLQSASGKEIFPGSDGITRSGHYGDFIKTSWLPLLGWCPAAHGPLLESSVSCNTVWEHAGIYLPPRCKGFSCPRLQLHAIEEVRHWGEDCSWCWGKPSPNTTSSSLFRSPGQARADDCLAAVTLEFFSQAGPPLSCPVWEQHQV